MFKSVLSCLDAIHPFLRSEKGDGMGVSEMAVITQTKRKERKTLRCIIVILLVSTGVVSCTCGTGNQSFLKQSDVVDSVLSSPQSALTDTASVVSPYCEDSLESSSYQIFKQATRDNGSVKPHKTPVKTGGATTSSNKSQAPSDSSKETDITQIQEVNTKTSRQSDSKKEIADVKIVSCIVEGRDPQKIVKPSPLKDVSGEVHVSIKIDRQGNVVFAEVDPHQSSINIELKQKARAAALASRFSSDDDAPVRQSGSIVYLFTAYKE